MTMDELLEALLDEFEDLLHGYKESVLVQAGDESETSGLRVTDNPEGYRLLEVSSLERNFRDQYEERVRTLFEEWQEDADFD